MSEMVDRVAKALYDRENLHLTKNAWDLLGPGHDSEWTREAYRGRGRDAIAAMYAPTQEMIDAWTYHGFWEDLDFLTVWQAAIDEACK